MQVYNTEDPNKLSNIDFHIINECNLNCKCCGHLCPLVENEKMMSFEHIEGQLKELSRLTKCGELLQTLTLTGGEITLRPDLYQVVELACQLFTCEIRMWSNGILYKKLIELAPLTKQYSNVNIFITDYEQKFTKKAQEEISKEVPRLFFVDKEEVNKKVYFTYQFFSKDKIAEQEAIYNCEPRLNCNQLVDYKLYVCQYLAFFKYFNKKFNDLYELPWNPNEGYIDIRTIDDIQDVKKFMKYFNCEFCQHCIDCSRYKVSVPWAVSKKEINEWYRKQY